MRFLTAFSRYPSSMSCRMGACHDFHILFHNAADIQYQQMMFTLDPDTTAVLCCSSQVSPSILLSIQSKRKPGDTSITVMQDINAQPPSNHPPNSPTSPSPFPITSLWKHLLSQQRSQIPGSRSGVMRRRCGGKVVI
jgi:hypothetical protein